MQMRYKLNGGLKNLEFYEGTLTLTITTGANASATYTWYVYRNTQIAQGGADRVQCGQLWSLPRAGGSWFWRLSCYF